MPTRSALLPVCVLLGLMMLAALLVSVTGLSAQLALPAPGGLPGVRVTAPVPKTAPATGPVISTATRGLVVKWRVPLFDPVKCTTWTDGNIGIDATNGCVIVPAIETGPDDGTKVNWVRAFRLADGAALWEYKETFSAGSYPPGYSTPVAMGASAFLAGYGSLLCLDVSTGSKRWIKEFEHPAVNAGPFPLAYAGRLYYALGYLYAVDQGSGAALWRFSPADAAGFDPSTAYVTSSSGLRAVDLATHSVRWTFGPTSGFSSWPPVVQGGLVFVLDKPGSTLYAVSTATGLVAWRRSLPNEFGPFSPVVYGSDKLYLYRMDSSFRLYLDAFNARDGSPAWSAQLPPGHTPRPIAINNVVLCAGAGIVAFEAATGRRLLSFSPPSTAGFMEAVATPSGDGLVAAGGDGSLYFLAPMNSAPTLPQAGPSLPKPRVPR